MSGRHKQKLPFDKKGGVIATPARMLRSDAYLSLRPQAKVLLILLQLHWNNHKPVDYGIREAADKIPCDRKTAMKAFRQLQDAGFIELIEHSMFSSRLHSKTRGWRLTWLPFYGNAPTKEWESLHNKNNPTGGKTTPPSYSQVPKTARVIHMNSHTSTRKGISTTKNQ